jgi:hypothetical protein
LRDGILRDWASWHDLHAGVSGILRDGHHGVTGILA